MGNIADPLQAPPIQQNQFGNGRGFAEAPRIRAFRPRRQMYSRIQKERAVRLLNFGVPCRQVASLMGPRCSSGTPIRWRQEAQRLEAARRRMEEAQAARRAHRF